MSKAPIKTPFPAYKGDSDYVFVSYSHADARLVYPELERLTRLGYKVWYDEGVSPGSRWSDELALRINNCALFIVMVTPDVAKSVHCQDELNYVLDADRPVLAIHLSHTDLPPGVKLRLGARQAILAHKLSSEEIDRKLNDVLSTIGVSQDKDAGQENIAKIDLSPGDVIGNFHLLEVLGEGGMGTVFLAEQREPVARRVALKVIKLGMDTKEVLARFEAERQALAVFSHPNIATVYESGATSTGRPYFVMEYVPGVSITQYCDDHRLDFRARVSLLKQACAGILHAHQKGIIHRDLKSSNLLVNEAAGETIVKIIDFGIAKSMQGSLASQTLYTRLGDVVGSPGFASPEQMSGHATDVDTRTDVYSLGIVLYELLAGTRPFDDDTFLSQNEEQIHYLLRNTQPPQPTTKLPRDNTLERMARLRALSPDKIHKALKGDLSSIVMRAIQGNRDDRYPSISSLVADFDRWLEGAPVEASAQTPTYLLSRFIKRHAAGVAIGMAIFTLLVGATITSTYSFLRASSEAHRANQLAIQSQTTVEFLMRLFEGSSPDNSPDPSLSARELLDQGAQRLREDASLDETVRLQLAETVGDVYLRLWLPEQAIALLRETIDNSISTLGEDHILVLRARIKLGDVLRANNELKESKEILQAAKKQIERVAEATIADKASLSNNLALVLNRTGDSKAAETLYLEALELRRIEQGEQSLSVAVVLHNLSLLYLDTRQLELAERYAQQSLDIRRELFHSKHSRVATSLSILSSIHRLRGNYEQAEVFAREVLSIRQEVFDPDSHIVAIAHYHHGRTLIDTGNWQGAREAYEQAMQIDPPDSVDWAYSAYRLALLEESLGGYTKAQTLAEASLILKRKQYGDKHRNVARIERFLAHLLHIQALDLGEAEKYARRAVKTLIELEGEQDISVAIAKLELAEVLNARGNSALATGMAEQSLNVIREDDNPLRPDLASSLGTLAEIYKVNGEYKKACSLFEEKLAHRIAFYESDHPYVDEAKTELSLCSQLL